MGYLKFSNPTTYDYNTSKQYQTKSRKLAVKQFYDLYEAFINRHLCKEEALKFGFEIEVNSLKVDSEGQYSSQTDNQYLKKIKNSVFEVHDEFAAYMIELIPQKPFTSFTFGGRHLYLYRKIMQDVQKMGRPGSVFLQLPFLPKSGTKDFVKEFVKEDIDFNDLQQIAETNPFTKSCYMGEDLINPHPRFKAFARNVRYRRGEKPQIRAPVFADTNTDMTSTTPEDPHAGEILFDSFAFGMGLSCLQVTFSAKHFDKARWAYDQFHMMTPLFLAFSASTPINKGKLLATDTRWEFLVQGCDCRNPEERLEGGLDRSRYGPFKLFMSNDKRNLKQYNDTKYTINKKMKKYIKKMGRERGIKLDNNMMNHLAYHLVRENMCIFEDDFVEEKTNNSTAHFEAFQSSNWNDVRFKPPPSLDSKLGWRVEFRSMDLQVVPEQNFLLTHAVQLIYRMITCEKLGLNLYIPISMVDENFRRANLAGAVTNQKFFFRKNVFDAGKPEIVELSLREYILGNSEFVGLKGIYDVFLTHNFSAFKEEYNMHKVCPMKQARATIDYLYRLATGEMKTNSFLIREFVKNHPTYQNDSIVNPTILNDMTTFVLDLQNGQNKEFSAQINSFVKN